MIPRAIPFSHGLQGGACWLCRRRDDGVGFLSGGFDKKFVPSCLDHIALGKVAFAMPRSEYDRYEQDAMLAAGDAGGEFLAGIGETDLAKLDEVQFIAFVKAVIDHFGKELEKRIQALEPPF